MRGVKKLATVTDNIQAIYDKDRSIVGPLETNTDGNLTCKNCDGNYKKSENNNRKYSWDSGTHSGLFRTNYSLDHVWYGWHEANPPKGSKYWKQEMLWTAG